VKAEIKVGASGQFTVDVDGKVVAEKKIFGFPSEQEIVSAVGAAMGKKSA
jgi:hypothetical protein